ncbi:MAG: ZIP family metal transporter [Candidatus Micrarchaeota archaeon]|nr:ZIP family metal transporter [Candidatus Micrarchaeota archaeon]
MVSLDLVLLGAIAGFTIYLGLPIARMKSVSSALKGMLNSAAAGILLFLLVDVMGDALGATNAQVLGGLRGTVPAGEAVLYPALLVGGVAAGLLGLVWFESRYIRSQIPKGEVAQILSEGRAALSEAKARRIALAIAVGIGLHNFSEGLAIGQSYAGGAISLALLLVVGFGLHNATEGFGIAAPLSGYRPSWKFLAALGLIGGGPTFLGAIVGGFYVSPLVSLFFLSLAAGAIIYVVKELLYHGRIHGEGVATMGFLVLGFFVGFGTDLLIKYASGGA